jgi:hypothetical protein
MPIIYVDNYRGFQETFLPLKSINFLVGENSTGKTSILKLIRILTDFKFWFNVDFNNEEADLGYFSEIASYSNPSRKDFIIGILGDNDRSDVELSAVKMKFISCDGLPILSEINFVEKGYNVQALVLEKSIKYRYDKITIENIQGEKKTRYFKAWIKKNGLKNKQYTELPLAEPLPNQAFFVVKILIFNQLKVDSTLAYSMPLFIKDLAWLAPIRTEPQRTYDRYNTNFKPDGTHSPYLLKKLLSDQKHEAVSKKVEKILAKFGSDSGLFDKISINPLGKSETAPFEVLVSLEGNPIKITNVGYGVSQILPIIVEVISRPNNSWFAIQQPEIHLHPRGQAAFGDLVFKSNQTEKKCFIIETHSDFIIDRFRVKLNGAKNKDGLMDSQVIFFSRDKGLNQLTCITIKNDGSYCEEQPKEFREFFIKEQIKLLNI